jgi:predicted O-methyltransferase YrrM
MKFTALTPELYDYLLAHGHNADPILRELAEETQKLGSIALMQIAPEQGSLLSMLVRTSGVTSAIEIGTFTGYSAICIARGLPADGTLLCCDVSEEWTAVARRYFDKSGVADRIHLRIAPAIETLHALAPEVRFDFAFIDADKVSYRAYYEALLPRMRANGLIVFDNVLWAGNVVDPSDTSPATVALRQLNDFLVSDDRVQTVMIPVADGLTLVRKRAADEHG